MVHCPPILLRIKQHVPDQAVPTVAPKYNLPSPVTGAVPPVLCACLCVPVLLPIREMHQSDLLYCVYCGSSRRLSLQCLQRQLLLRFIATSVFRRPVTFPYVLLCLLAALAFP